MTKPNYQVKLSIFAIALLIVMLPALSSCKKETADVSSLIATVPSSAGAVIGIDLATVLEKAGCKVDGAKIKPGEELLEWIDSQKDYASGEKEALKLLLSGDSGIDPVGAVIFVDAYDTYVTAMLADTSGFKEFVKKQTGSDFEESDGVAVSKNVAVAGAQAWMNITSESIDVKAVKNYAGLDKEQSFLSNEFAAHLKEMTHDVTGWGQLNTLMRKGVPMGDVSSLSLFAGMCFDGATSMSFNLDFQKGGIEATAGILNSKGEKAKFLLPMEKIDVSEIKTLGDDAQMVVALSITKSLTKKLEKLSSSLGGNMFGVILNMLKSIDGTVAFASSALDNFDKGMNGFVTTDGSASPDLMNMLSQFGSVRKDGKLVWIKQGELAGGIELDEAGEFLKGAFAGVVFNADAAGLDGAKYGFRSMAITLSPDGKGIELKVVAKGVDKSENMLLTLLKNNK